jgi:acyl-CoA thioester hydrolase
MPRHDPRRLDASAYPWSVALETRFGDMDVNFHLNNVAVAGLYEEARVRFNWHLRDGFTVGRPRFLVARVEIDYLGEGRYRVPTTMGVAVSSTGTSSWRVAMGLFQPDGCIGLCDTVMVHRGDAGPAPIPDSLRSALGEFALRP